MKEELFNLQHAGTILDNLRDKMPKRAGAEVEAKAKQAWELIYKGGTTLKGNKPLKP